MYDTKILFFSSSGTSVRLETKGKKLLDFLEMLDLLAFLLVPHLEKTCLWGLGPGKSNLPAQLQRMF